MAITDSQRIRIEQTVACHDADGLPKVAGAGSISDGVQLMHNGVRVVEGGYHGEWMAEVIQRLDGHHEPQEEAAFHAVVERLAETTPDATVMELGSFWAYYALWALERMPQARAFLVEPDPANLEVGRRNFALNGRKGEFVQAAVGASAEPPSPFICESDGASRDIPTESLPSLFERFGLDRLDLLMCDIQGAEDQLLEGAADLLSAGRVRFVIVSTHHHLISGDPLTHQRCVDLLQAAGAHVVVEHTVAESCSGDGLVVASFDPRDRDLRVELSRTRAQDSMFGDPLHDLAAAHSSELVAREHLERLQTDLDAGHAAEAAIRARLDAAEAEMATIRATLSWRAHERLLPVLRPLRRIQRLLPGHRNP